MSNNFKEQAVYDYMHDNKDKIKPKYRRSILNKWKRYNCEIAEDRVIRNRKRNNQFNKERMKYEQIKNKCRYAKKKFRFNVLSNILFALITSK